MSTPLNSKRYTLTLAPDLFEQVSQAAVKHQRPVVDMLRLFIRLGLRCIDADEQGEVVAIRNAEGKERIITLV